MTIAVLEAPELAIAEVTPRGEATEPCGAASRGRPRLAVLDG